MKKLLLLITVLILMQTGMAQAENVPTPYMGSQSESAQEEATQPETTDVSEVSAEATAEEKAEKKAEKEGTYIVPEGKKAYQYMMHYYDLVGFYIGDYSFVDVVQATDAAVKSVKIEASRGHKLLDLKYVFRMRYETHYTFGTKSLCTVMDGKGNVYPTSMWVESSSPDILKNYSEAIWHLSIDTNDHPNMYLVPVVEGLLIESKYEDHFALFDCVAEIPEEVLSSDVPLYIVFHSMGDTDYYMQISH